MAFPVSARQWLVASMRFLWSRLPVLGHLSSSQRAGKSDAVDEAQPWTASWPALPERVGRLCLSIQPLQADSPAAMEQVNFKLDAHACQLLHLPADVDYASFQACLAPSSRHPWQTWLRDCLQQVDQTDSDQRRPERPGQLQGHVLECLPETLSSESRFLLIEPITLAPLWKEEQQRSPQQALMRLNAWVYDISPWMRAQRAAEQADQAKSRLLASVCHELRNPLHAMATLVALQTGQLSDEQRRKDIAELQRSTEDLIRLLNDLLDYSRLHADALPIEQVPFNLRAVLDRCYAMFMPLASVKGVKLAVRCEFEGALPLLGDPLRLQQILYNVLSNAIKFTHRGTVSLYAYAEKMEEGDKMRLRFDIIDTGIGLTQFQRQHLFEPFAQANDSTTRLFGGSGLGLYIVRGLVAAMGGQLQVQSLPGVGSCFSISLQLASVLASRRGDELDVSSSGGTEVRSAEYHDHGALPALTVLIVDDYALNRELIRRYLEKYQHRVIEADSGPAALACFQQHPDIQWVLMDLDMPGMDGYTAARQLQEQALMLSADISVCALTGMSMDGERLRLAGIQSYLPKPVSLDLLRLRLQDRQFQWQQKSIASPN